MMSIFAFLAVGFNVAYIVFNHEKIADKYEDSPTLYVLREGAGGSPVVCLHHGRGQEHVE